MLVLGLLAVIMFLAVPGFQNLLQGTLQQEVNRLSGVIRLLRNEAVLTNTRYRLMFDLKAGRYFVEQQDEYGAFVRREDPAALRGHAFPEDLALQDVVLFGRIEDEDRAEPLPIVVDGSGYVDPFLLRFTHGGSDYTLRVAGFTGRVTLEEGHAER